MQVRRGHTYFMRMCQGARKQMGGGEKIRMVYLNRFLCVDAGMLVEPMRLQHVKCYMITASCHYHTNIGLKEKRRQSCSLRFLESKVRCLGCFECPPKQQIIFPGHQKHS